jgi:hypothetical protein
MATIKLTITVDKLDNVLTLFEVIKVYRAAVEAGPYVEITGPGIRIDLIAGQTVYFYDDVAGDPAYYYKTSYFHETTLLESSLSDPIQGESDALIVSIQDLRDEGVPSTVSDDRILLAIQTWQAFVERACRQWFYPRQMTWDLDGNGTTLLQLPVPIISLSTLYMNDDFVNPVEVDAYVVYNGRGENGRDDRRNPRIKLISAETSIFEGVGPVQRNSFTFMIGEKNQRLVGSFGYVEPDGSTPAPVRYAVKKLAIRGIEPLYNTGGAAGPTGSVIEEETDRHRRKWSDPTLATKAWSMSGDAEVDQIIAMYRAPISMRAPRSMFRRLSGRSAV